MDKPHFDAAVETTTVFGRITPELKERLVGALRDDGRYVAMTGDGVNDVLSLKRSNLAIAMGSGTQAARGVADLILIDDGFSALASAISEGQRILNGMQDILRVFLTRILTLGMLILVLMTSGFFPVDLRNASAITLFTVGIPTAMLAIWSRPGPFLGESLLRTLAKFVLPAASLASVVGLLVVTGVFLIGNADFEAGLTTEQAVEEAAKTSVTVFLILVGMLVIVFVEPPVKLFAVIEPLSPDWRPTWLALALTSALGIVLLVPPFRTFFNLHPLSIRDLAIVLGGTLVWAVLVWIFWRWRFVERFLGADVNS
jgi:cation-transporting ATPase E